VVEGLVSREIWNCGTTLRVCAVVKLVGQKFWLKEDEVAEEDR
jgi:hypothetical protein